MREIVGEPDIVEDDLYAAASLEDSDLVPVVDDRRSGVEQREDPLRARHRSLKDVVLLRQILKRLEESTDELKKRGDRPHAENVGVHARRARNYQDRQGY